MSSQATRFGWLTAQTQMISPESSKFHNFSSISQCVPTFVSELFAKKRASGRWKVMRSDGLGQFLLDGISVYATSSFLGGLGIVYIERKSLLNQSNSSDNTSLSGTQMSSGYSRSDKTKFHAQQRRVYGQQEATNWRLKKNGTKQLKLDKDT